MPSRLDLSDVPLMPLLINNLPRGTEDNRSSLRRYVSVPAETELVSCIKCPNCRKSVPLPPGGVSELPPAFLINNLLEVQKTTEFENVQPRTECAGHTLLCDEHERVLEFYCKDCGVLLCSVCAIKGHHAHNCDLAADVAKFHRKLIEDQLALLRRDVAHVDSMIAHVDSTRERLISEGDVTKKAITDAVEQLHRHIEDRKTKLMAMLNQNIEEKLLGLKNHREKGLAMKAHMRKSESTVEGKLERLNDSIEIMVVKNELVQLISEVRLNPDALKFTAPNMISFSSHPPNTEIGFLFEPAEKHGRKKLVAGNKMYCYSVYLPGLETDIVPVCQLVPSNKAFKPFECQVSSLGKGKYKVMFTFGQVGNHELVMFPFSPSKKTTVAELHVNSAFLQGNRKQILKQMFRKPSAMALTGTGDLIVCESAGDCVTILAPNDGKKLSAISLLSGSKKKCLSKPCCVGVTPDNCIIVIDSGKQCYRLHKIQIDGKLIATANLTNTCNDTLQLQSPNALAVHPCGEIYVVDSDSHSIFVFNANLTFCRLFGGKGKARGYFDQPHSVAFDSAGNAYVSDSMNHRIQKFSTSGLLQVDAFGSGNGTALSHLTRPTALCISSYDTIFVTDEHKRIAAFDARGFFLGEVRYSKISLTNPCAMVVGKDESYLSVLDSYVEALYIIQ